MYVFFILSYSLLESALLNRRPLRFAVTTARRRVLSTIEPSTLSPAGVLTRGGQNHNLLPSTYTSTFDHTGRRPSLPFKKGRIERSMLTTFDLWKGVGRRHDLSLHWKCKIPRERSYLGQICVRGDILTPAQNRFLPLLASQIPTLWDTYIWGGRGIMFVTPTVFFFAAFFLPVWHCWAG